MKLNRWDDYYAQKARKEGYLARSVYKLIEIQKKRAVLKRGGKALDLGAYPGSWLQFISKVVGKTGLVVGIDIVALKGSMPENVQFIQADVLSLEKGILDEFPGGFDTILSDMAPKTSGNKFVDTQRSLLLCKAALNISDRYLRPRGAFVCKVFQGDGFEEFLEMSKKRFEKIKLIRPKSTRKASKEIYVIGLRNLGIEEL
ncbi:MAG: RlmE family RNA methyltransferase [Pseudomonadota bacterium]